MKKDLKDQPVVGLNSEEKQFLLRLARRSIRSRIDDSRIEDPPVIPEKLREKFGTFVTLHFQRRLRGCIGYVEGIKPLYQAVMEMARSAAFEDPRFSPLKKDELDKCDIEITVLSPLQRVHSVEQIKVGEHGLMVKQGIKRGLLLPQVAVDWQWDRKTFLEQTCHKANLPADCWQNKETEIYLFAGEIFSEEEFQNYNTGE
ncbi:MAG: AmmeMemoRadiSam system protein A [Calditrichia bacterium]